MKEQRDDGQLWAVAGTSRYGKTKFVKELVLVPAVKRIVVFDIRGEYVNEKGFITVDNIPELARVLRESGTGPLKVTYWGSVEDFPDWCRLAYLWGQKFPACIIAEEISDVTGSGKAPKGWGDLIRKGLFYGNWIFSITQRPQECDNTMWGNATVMHCHGFVLDTDQDYIGRRLGCKPEQIAAMAPGDWVERRQGVKDLIWGHIDLV